MTQRIKSPCRSSCRLNTTVFLVASLLCISGCGPGNGTNAADRNLRVYRHAMDGAPVSLDPAQASDIYAKSLVVNLYDTLYRYKYLARPYELTANLAAGPPEVSPDGLTYKIRIKPGVRFIDDEAFPGGHGREVQARDFVYSLERQFDPTTRAQGAWLWQGKIVGLDEWKEDGADYNREISGLRALDEYTIQIRLTAPFPQLIHTLAQGFAAIVPREAVEHYGREFAVHPVGSGPFRLLRFDSAGASLVRNPDFRAEPVSLAAEGYDPAAQGSFGLEAIEGKIPPLADRVDIEFIAEDAARWNTFNSGQLDFVKVPVSQFDRVLESRAPPRLRDELARRFHLLANLESGFVYTVFNMADGRIGYNADPQQDARNHALRCAIIKAFDWQRRNEIFYSGLGVVFPGIIPPITPEYDPDQSRESIERDTGGAIRLLRDSGWNQGNLPVLEYGFPSSVTEQQMFEQFRSFITAIGYPREKIRPLIYATYGDYARAYIQRNVMLVTSSWTMDYPDAENTMQLFFGPNSTPGANTANYNNQEFNRLYRAGSSLPASPERTAMYRKMNRIVIDDCVAISGISRTLVLLWDREVRMLPDREFVGGYYFRFVDVPPGRDRDQGIAGADRQ